MINIIVAAAENGVIGRGNAIPWHLPEDLKLFKRLTLGHTLIMGRRTFESIGKPLPGRRTIVVSRTLSALPGAETASSLEAALEAARDAEEVFIAGGGQIYAEAMASAERLYLSVIPGNYDGDTVFPPVKPGEWRLEREEPSPGFVLRVYYRINPAGV